MTITLITILAIVSAMGGLSFALWRTLRKLNDARDEVRTALQDRDRMADRFQQITVQLAQESAQVEDMRRELSAKIKELRDAQNRLIESDPRGSFFRLFG